MKRGNRNLWGFTLLELMVVVFIIGVLAAVAIPMLNRYLKKSKTSEAGLNLRKIYDGEISYYQEDHTLSDGSVASKTFISNAPVPLVPTNQKQLGDFETRGWKLIKFSADGPVQFSYSTDALGQDTTASFTARAEGDIDGDGLTSLFERVASVTPAGEIEGGAAIYTMDELE